MLRLIKGPSKNLLRESARELERFLRNTETSSLEPWQREIREYLGRGKMPTLLARNNLAAWVRAKRSGR